MITFRFVYQLQLQLFVITTTTNIFSIKMLISYKRSAAKLRKRLLLAKNAFYPHQVEQPPMPKLRLAEEVEIRVL